MADRCRKIDNILNSMWEIMLLLILCFPRNYSSIKLALAAVIIMLWFISNRELPLPNMTLVFYCMWSVYILYILAVGIYYSNSEKAIIDYFRLGIFNFGLYLLLVAVAVNCSNIEISIRAIYFAELYIGLFNCLLLVFAYTGHDISFFGLLDPTARVGIHTGYSHVVATNMSMLILLYPLSLHFLKDRITLFRMITVGIATVAMVISGRRILWIVLALSVVMYVVFYYKRPAKFLAYSILGIVTMVIGIYFLNYLNIVSFDGLIDRFTSAFSKIDETGSLNVRNVQSALLMKGFWDHPIFGNGAGAVIDGFARDETTPWSFEMSYHVVLFQSGVVGSFLYAACFVFVLYRIIRIRDISTNAFYALSTTYISVLVANATNPYITSSFDFHVFVFLPLLLIEQILREKVGSRLIQQVSVHSVKDKSKMIPEG